MRSFIVFVLIGATAQAGSPCFVQHQVVTTATATIVPVVTVVPVAQAAGIPVAQVSTVQYYPRDYASEAVVAQLQALNAKLEAALAGGTVVGARAANPYPMLTAKCAGCHQNNQKAAAAFSFASIESLTCDQRLAATDAVLNDRMPKGGKLTPDEAGALLKELTKRPANPPVAARPVPAPPQPPAEDKGSL